MKPKDLLKNSEASTLVPCMWFMSVPKENGGSTHEDIFSSASSAAQVFPNVVMITPPMLTNTATIFATFKESWPKNAPKKRVNSPEVDDKTVVLATLVRARAAFEKY